MARQSGAQIVGNQVVGNFGMYYGAYRLSQKGWNVMAPLYQIGYIHKGSHQ